MNIIIGRALQEMQERADAAAAKAKAADKEKPPEPHMKPAQPESSSSTIGPELPFREVLINFAFSGRFCGKNQNVIPANQC